MEIEMITIPKEQDYHKDQSGGIIYIHCVHVNIL